MGNIVAIVGRPNVGKSTLFNRMTGAREAIIHESSGVTRDRHYGRCEWNGQDFSVIDTGGYAVNSGDVFEAEIRKQVVLAMEESDVILFVVDVLTGITDLDDEVASMLRRNKKPCFLVANKVDNGQLQYQASEFYSLGLGEVYCLSAINGSGTGDLLDQVLKAFPKREPVNEEQEKLPKFAVVGRPNVGKSSLINALLGQERNIVTPVAGTTRDSIHTRFNKYGHDFMIVDTAGLRKKAKVQEDVEFYSTLRTIKAIEDADVCLLMIDATRGIEHQDLSVFHVIQKNHKGVVVLVNKWDLVEKDTNSVRDFTKILHERFAPFNDLPIIFTSALTKQRINKALDEAMDVYKNMTQRIPTSKLNEVMLQEIENFHPPMLKGKMVSIKYVTQLPTRTPIFAFFANLPQYVKDPYKRYLENKLREHYNFKGVPIQVVLRKK